MDHRYTQDEVAEVARALLASVAPSIDTATIIGLSGDLGAGKTTLVQAIGKVLGVDETIVSPTFVIAKYYNTRTETFQKLIHIDAYRIEDPQEMNVLGWDTICSEPQTLVVVEWPERIEALLPDSTHRYRIMHSKHERHIQSV